MSHTIDRHNYSVHKDVKPQCESCDYYTTDNNNLKRHKNSVHIQGSDMPVILVNMQLFISHSCNSIRRKISEYNLNVLNVNFKMERLYLQEHRYSQHFGANKELLTSTVPVNKELLTSTLEGGRGGGSGEVRMVSQLLPVLNYDSFPQVITF